MFWNIINSTIAGVAAFFSIKNALDRKKHSRPSVIFMDQLGDYDTSFGTASRFELHFVNTGNREAVNVTIPDKFIRMYPFLEEWSNIRRELAANVGRTKCAKGYKTSITSEIEELVINYEDTTGKKFSTKYENGRFIFS